jgi:hypothetical protein
MRASEPFQTLTQTLRIYQPDGRAYSVTQFSMGSPDMQPNPKNPQGPKDRVGKGRETLPLTELQLSEIGLGALH